MPVVKQFFLSLYLIFSSGNEICNHDVSFQTCFVQSPVDLHQKKDILVIARKYNFSSHQNTVTDLANFCVTPLFRCPQGSQGCLEKRNHPLSSNLVVWCAKETLKNRRKTIIFDIFLSILRFFELSWFWAQFQRTKPPNSNSVDDFASLNTPGSPGGI